MSTARKALKLARMLEDLQAIRESVRTLKSSRRIIWIVVLRALAAVFELAYYYFDHVEWLNRNQLVDSAKSQHAARASFRSSVFWLLNAVCDALADTFTYNALRCACSRNSCAQDGGRYEKQTAAATTTTGIVEQQQERCRVAPCGASCKSLRRAPLVKIWLDVVTAAAETEVVLLPADGTALIEASAGLGASILGLRSVWAAVLASMKPARD